MSLFCCLFKLKGWRITRCVNLEEDQEASEQGTEGSPLTTEALNNPLRPGTMAGGVEGAKIGPLSEDNHGGVESPVVI